ncbi:MAG: tRNA (adenosine(37)-N6)-dimethylallyltransferase MiaA [Candidatus Eremiobacteraeota bacterium]|nr:tRNA (adenosine(37)-N6)-dimethylallyltransferase MiaA [Candidatus Eremiobacteraeota bacterium]
MQGVLVVAGATTAGKTECALELARAFGAEIVSADSRQVYRGMPIGTAAPTEEQRSEIPHHLVGFLDPTERYSAARFAAEATAIVRNIHNRGKRAIVVGGTGFYIRALTGAISLASQFDEALREELAREARVHPPEFLHARLALRDPERAAALAPNDSYRIVRALEIALAPRFATLRAQELETLRSAGIPFYKVFLDVPLPQLDERIARRAEGMLVSGMLEEAERIGASAVAANAVGYPHALAYLRGLSTVEELRELLARATRRYARRQRAWFRREPDTEWMDCSRIAIAAREKLGWS